ncbi:putative spermidine/putrescine transport system permease protein [Nitrobacteraceae bacterium AZCC 2146]
MEDRLAPWMRATLLLTPAALLVALFMLAPIGLLLAYSLLPANTMALTAAGGVTLHNYGRLLLDWYYLRIIGSTMIMSLIVTLASVVIAWPLAYFLWRSSKRWRPILTMGLLAPLLVSIPIRNYGWVVLLDQQGIINQTLIWLGITASPIELVHSDFGMVLGLTHVLMPFVVLSALATLDRVNFNIVDAARTLGAGRLRVAMEIVFPLAVPGIVSGAILVFCIAISSYVTPALMGRGGTSVATLLIYEQFMKNFDWPFGAAIAIFLVAVSGLVLMTSLWGANRYFGRLVRGI